MTITILEYFKIILEKVSFDAKLFEKELRKAINQLLKPDLIALKKWCYEQFGIKYRNILKSTFASISFRRTKKKAPILG
jgi:coproporphyrinogen III oxidase